MLQSKKATSSFDTPKAAKDALWTCSAPTRRTSTRSSSKQECEGMQMENSTIVLKRVTH
ncbi:unnamed protein product [Meloidogyne enterolobii]|uniref:Uncharacterized protein n=1 Tax=Meloidogyne enterolobii TaxID=390850 RepID=A0ACB0Z0R7_MELEN